MRKAFSGRPLEDITLEALLDGQLGLDDVRIHPDTLRRQAEVAREDGNAQLASNLRRAAELTALGDDELLEIYDALRPRRSTRRQLEQLIERLEGVPAPHCASLVREALDAYAARDLLA